jgi:outer membrane protein assembly factor BamB
MLFSFHRASRRPLVLVSVSLILGTLPVSAGDVIGWRTDGSGSYPKAEPPLEWSPTKNVVWSTPMKYGVSHPVLLGERIYICSEPATLICLNRKDGEILWQKTSSYADLEIAPDVRERINAEQTDMAAISKKESGVRKEMDLLNRMLVKDAVPKEEIEKKLQPFRTQIDELKAEKEKLKLGVLYTQPGIHSTAGYSAPTPVTDGKNIYVAFGNGLVACFDMEGDRKWLKLIEHSNAPYAHSNSPVLAGGKLIIHFTEMVALDTKTGTESWRLKRPTYHGTSIVTKIGDVEVLLTPKGMMVRAQDGKVLAEGLGSCGSNSPILHERIIYYVHGNATAVRLPESLEEPMKLPALWKARVKSSGYGFASPVIYDGLLYSTNDQNILTVLEIDTGKVVYEERLTLQGAGYPSISQAGNHIYVSSDTGETVVLQPGREYKELARNKLEEFRSSLVFEGKRVYIRTAKHLFCIGQ